MMENGENGIFENKKSTKEVVDLFVIKDDIDGAIEYLKENKDEIGEFCLLVKESYKENDTTSVVLRLAEIIEKLI